MIHHAPLHAALIPIAAVSDTASDPIGYLYQLGGFAAAVVVGYWAINMGEKKLAKSKDDADYDLERAMALFEAERRAREEDRERFEQARREMLAEHEMTRQLLFEALKTQKDNR